MQYLLRLFILASLIGVTLGCEGPELPNKKKRQSSVENFPESSSAGAKVDGELITTASGLKYKDLREGSGPAAKNGDLVAVHYAGYLKDGTQFDSNVTSSPFTLTLGKAQVIKGWDEGLVGMKAGSERKLIIPADLAYGLRGSPPRVPENAELTFNVQMVKIY
jgi:FKBP-type peptidyl-prolyl cis-trans isomerase